MCVVVCRQVVYVSTGSRNIVLLSVSVCRCVLSGCLCVSRFKKNCIVESVCVVMCRQVVFVSIGSRKIVLLSVSVCQHVSSGCLRVDRFKKNWIVVCRCVSSCVVRSFFCVDIC